MPEDLLQKLEEKMMLVLAEVEKLREANQRLNQENFTLKADKESHVKKLQELIGLLDAVSFVDNAAPNNMLALKPLMTQGDKIYE